MSRFNNKVRPATPDTQNLAGGDAYAQDPKLQLVSILLTSFVQDKFYRTAQDEMAIVADLVRLHKVDPLFAAKAAVFARNEFGMRSITHVLAGDLAANVKGEQWTKRFYEHVVRRPDDVTEILSYYKKVYGKPLPNSLKKGLALALAGFSEYQLAKYQGKNKGLALVDVVNLTHPKANAALTALMTGTLKPADTWEVALTQAGQKAETDADKAELKMEAWGRLLRENKLGYMAILRNLRNISQQADLETMALAAKRLTNVDAIKKSLVLPFRFVTAMDTVGADLPRTLQVALAEALEISLNNVPELPGKSLVAIDVSGSMMGGWHWGEKSTQSPISIAATLGAALYKKQDADIILFDGKATYIKDVNPMDSMATISKYIKEKARGGSTNFHSIFQMANKAYDRIFILSDMQGWDGGYKTPERDYKEYCRRFSATPYLYSFDLTGYSTTQFPQNKVFALAGFSDKIFDIMDTLEQDREALVHAIEKIEI